MEKLLWRMVFWSESNGEKSLVLKSDYTKGGVKMSLKIAALIIICICMVVGIILSARYLRNMVMWAVIALLLVGLLIGILNLSLLMGGKI